MSSTVLERLQRRHRAFEATRAFFRERGFVEADTPVLTSGPGLEPHIDPLSVRVQLGPNGPRERRFLITSPELALKRLVSFGARNVFQMGHVFRDGERTARHLPEFTMLEWYRAGSTLDDLVLDHEELFAAVASALGISHPPTPFPCRSLSSLFDEHAGIDLTGVLVRMRDGDALALVSDLRGRGEVLRSGADFEDAFFHVMTNMVEPRLGRDRPVVVERWPAQMAVLARRCDDDPLFAARFEIYAGGLELSNAFDELTDAVEQRSRFESDNEKRRELGKETLPLDEEFLDALPQMPRTAGCALGFDRLLMYLLKEPSIDDVIALPWR